MPAFDPIALNYDRDFTGSRTGILQREEVRDYLDRHLATGKPLRILELGCGTGEDAIHLARQGHHVLATDISREMIEVAKAKARRETFEGSLAFEVLDMRNLEHIGSGHPYDLVFSNFGALNCLEGSEIRTLFNNLYLVIAPGGQIIVMVMPDLCLWESLYFILKRKWGQVLRRKKKNGVLAVLGESSVRTWYYSPRKLVKLAGGHFKFIRKRPVGFFLPPSYVDPFFRERKKWLYILGRMEKSISGISLLAGFSDHYILELKRKP